MKRLLLLLTTSAMLAFILSGALAETKIMVVSDIHFLSHSLYEDESPSFAEVVSKGAGKATQYSSELLDGLLAEARHQRPDILLLAGDLSFNGEAASHLELAEAMRELKAEGIPVAVIPGNHDINSENAVRFTDAGIERVDAVDSAAFGRIWQGMTAEALPGPAFSGVVKVNDRVWLALGDYSVYEERIEAHGVAGEAHEQWMTGVMAAAAEAGAQVISVSHQTLLTHTNYSSHTFRVINGEKIAKILSEGGCRLNLCGHMHIQHILPGDELTDIATGAWCVSPHRYGIVTVEDGGALRYEAHSVCGEHLPEGLIEATREFFRNSVYKGERIELMSLGVFDQKLLDMVRFAMDVNEYYFAGTLYEHPEVFTDPALDLWKQYERSSNFAHYLTLLLSEDIVDSLRWSGTM